MIILAIETSCDETGLALIETDHKNKVKVLANLLSSQIEVHRPYGGVVPNLAKREHIKNLEVLWKKLLVTCNLKLETLDLIAVTQGPGLAPCLWAGINFAADLAKKLNKPLVGINHLKGHIFVNLLRNKIEFPALTLIVSGGHTELVYSKKLGHYQILGQTLDDAAGEAFDKVARLLGLNYPGGPEIAKLAEKGDPAKFDLPRPMISSDNFDFSFSGLKTSVLYLVKGLHPQKTPLKLTKKNLADLCASFQQAVVDVLITKTVKAAKKLKPKTLILGGGVAANTKLREILKLETKKLKTTKLILPDPKLTTDNALMIALAALAEIKSASWRIKPVKNPEELEADANLGLEKK
ncbi:MAG: tRNA (adenosine(37)-N6)-threonylcarbamoyltransferase complex transferase subunit TsaD [bacterium]|nr:tRNA (adenosine(37)-N6)-threonylcarbamoyltransferase complex transferase subunit TsaD [bacterium]